MSIAFSPVSSPSFQKASLQPSFGGFTRNQMRERLTAEGVPEGLDASSKCFTGRKNFDFPNTPHLNPTAYPDITQHVEDFKAEIIGELRDIQGNNRVLGLKKAMKYMAAMFPTGEPWDTKYLPQFPGRDLNGKTQYALYKGEVVSANYISNNLYGQITAALGLPLWFSRMAAKMDACGLAELIFKHRLPKAELRQFRDTAEDQDAIISAYDDYFHNDPWRNPNIDPKRPYPPGESPRRLEKPERRLSRIA